MAGPVRKAAAAHRKLVHPDRNQTRRRTRGRDAGRGPGGQADAHPPGRFPTCRRQISAHQYRRHRPATRRSARSDQENLMTRSLLAVTSAALALLAIPLCHALESGMEAVDGIAAVVNGDVITYSQVRSLTSPREKVLRSQLTGEELNKQLKIVREAALKDLIDRQLIIQSFKKEGFNIPDHVIDQRVDEIIKESFGGDRNTFIKTL